MSDRRKNLVSPSPPPPLSPSSVTAAASHTIMFWVLSGMALVVFAPCVLVPIYQELQQVKDYKREMRGAVKGLEAQATKNQQRIDALREDPLVNERIARRELNLQPDDERVVRVSGRELSALRLNMAETNDALEAEAADAAPHWTQRLTHWLPAWPYAKLFGNKLNRRVLMGMAGGLLVAAFILFGKKPVQKARTARA